MTTRLTAIGIGCMFIGALALTGTIDAHAASITNPEMHLNTSDFASIIHPEDTTVGDACLRAAREYSNRENFPPQVVLNKLMVCAGTTDKLRSGFSIGLQKKNTASYLFTVITESYGYTPDRSEREFIAAIAEIANSNLKVVRGAE